MTDELKTKQELVEELTSLRQRIVELERAEENLKESEKRFRISATSTSDLIWDWSILQGKLEWFGTIDEMLGYAPGEFPRTIKAWENAIHPDDHDRVMSTLENHLNTQTPYVEEYRVITKDGVLRYWIDRGGAMRDEKGNAYRMVGACTDITERKQMEEELSSSEQKFRGLIEKMPVGIFIYEGTKIRYVNPACERITGYTQDDLYLFDIWEIAHPEFKDSVREYVIRRQRKEPVPELNEIKIITKNGEELWLERGAIAIELQGKPFVLVTVIDVTERKRTENTLEGLVRERTAELSDTNKQLVEEIMERKRAEAALRKKTNELLFHSGKLEELNAALKVLLQQREEDRTELEEKVISNVKHLLSPHLDKLKKRKFDPKSKMHLDILESNLHNIVSSFSHKLSSKHISLTPTEIKVANLVREGKTTKEIAEFLGSSPSSINIHRFHIRRKLGLIGKETNLQSYLTSLS